MAQRIWFITGVSSGFGRHLAEQLLQRGDKVIGTVRSASKVSDLAERYPEAFHVELLDLTDTPAIRKVVERSFARFRRIDVIISNAGYGLFGAAEEFTDSQVEQIGVDLTPDKLKEIRTAPLADQGAGRSYARIRSDRSMSGESK
jgi:NAD(P)-dependent dehydrogenase (short-subunit alcohol dehydrogenase family)